MTLARRAAAQGPESSAARPSLPEIIDLLRKDAGLR